MPRFPIAALAVAALSALAGCDAYPRDADNVTALAAERSMLVGASHDPPWVGVTSDGRVSGPEAELVRGFAKAHGYRLRWLPGGHDALMRELEQARLHAVIGGHHPDSPWQPKVGWSQPLHLRAGADAPMPERRIALPPGQSAWQLEVDRHLLARDGQREGKRAR